jgi:predicted PurR-regulated permease PerM
MPDAFSPQETPAAPEPVAAPPGPMLPTPMRQISIIVAIAVVAALYFGREVLIPVTLAFLLTFILSPLVELLRRAHLGHITSVVIAVFLALGIIIGLGSAIGTQVASLAQDIPRYQQTIEKKIVTLRDTTVKRLSQQLEALSRGFNGGPEKSRPPAAPTPAAPQAPAEAQTQEPAQKPVPVIVTQPNSSALDIGKRVITPLINPLATAGIILVVTIFALLQKEDLRDRAIRLLGSNDLQRSTVALDDAGRRLSRYFLTQLALNTSFGVIVACGLYLIGVPNPVLWGVLGALLRFIPYIGSWIAAMLPIVLAAAVSPGWLMAAEVAALYAVVELIMGQFVEPLLYGHSTGLSPLAVIIAAIFWTWVWGPIGLIISTPLTLCLVVLGRHVKQLEFFDVLLGDRPALSPVASFYQRMLADDPDEVEELAERYLANAPLSDYYDEVVLQGLQLAANDIARGTLTPAQVERLQTATTELVQELAKYPDVLPPNAKTVSLRDEALGEHAAPAVLPDALAAGPLAPEWEGDAPVLCLAGRGRLDEAAAAMLAQLLAKHGLGARVVAHAAASRSHLTRLDVSGVAMVCLSYLDIGGNPAHLRHLLRRLRARLPSVPILVGLWPAQDPILHDRDLRQAVGADYYVTTLREAVETCIAAAHRGTG